MKVGRRASNKLSVRKEKKKSAHAINLIIDKCDNNKLPVYHHPHRISIRIVVLLFQYIHPTCATSNHHQKVVRI